MTSPTPRGRVLIVDDQKNWRETLEELLQAEGYRVHTADTLAQARAILSDAEFDVAILDIRLLDEDRYDVQGLQLLKEIKTTGRRTEALILTGYVHPGTESRVKELGAATFLFKAPRHGLDIGEFRRAIGRLVHRARAGRGSR